MRILILEDCPLTADHLAHLLRAEGCDIVAAAATARDAIQVLNTVDCDAAIVDVNLAGSNSIPAASALALRKIPFVVVSGYPARELPQALRGAPFVPKPVHAAALLSALQTAMKPPHAGREGELAANTT
jgi:DNA-binding NarL/FixJ family response regulator